MATLGYMEAREAENLFELGSANQELLCGVNSDCRRRFSVGSSQIAEEGSYQVGSVLTEAKALGCHFYSSGQVGWAGSVPC